MRPTSHYLEVLTAEVFEGENHLGGSTPPVIRALARKPLKISLDPADYKSEQEKVLKFLAKHSGSAMDEVSLVPGSTQACFQALAAITNPGDTIIIEAP